MSDIQAISGTRRAMKEMADGTLRVQIDIDPRFRAQFFALFGQIDMPVALAPLVANFEQKKSEPEKAKGGELAKWAAIRCAEEKFREFLWHVNSMDEVPTENEATELIYLMCHITSRAELDNNPEAKRLFDQRIRRPYADYCARPA